MNRAMHSVTSETVSNSLDFLAGGGTMAELIRAFDWSNTPLGPPENWSPVLRTVLRMMLVNRFPMLLWWGPEYVQFYNDAYSPIPGAKHPKSLGQTGRECWAEVWNVLGPLVDTPFRGGPATWSEDLELELYRTGFTEETHFTVAYSAVPDESAPGGIGGVLATVHEITEQVIGERRISVLRDLGTSASGPESAKDACASAAEAIAKHPKDIPFALLYLTDPDGRRAQLAASAGFEHPPSAAPVNLERASEPGVWPLSEVNRSQQMQLVANLTDFGEVPRGPWPDPPIMAAVLPIRSNIARQLSGFLVAGLSSRLKFDNAYKDFLELATTQLANGIASALAYEEERKRAEALAEIDRAKTLFFSNVSHEFRTPLTLMLGPLEDLLTKPGLLPPREHEEVEIAHRNSLRLLKLVNSLLDFSRIEAGRVRASFQPVDLAALTSDLASNFRSAMNAAGLELIVDCPPLPEAVYIDREMWEKIVLNLLSNAFKFTFRGNVTVRLHAEGDRGVLTVSDTGVGIPESELPRIFERFHRVDGVQGRSYEGTGIGLALIQELVKLHGGSVSASSTLKKGSEFTVSIPFGQSHLPADRVEAATDLASTAVRAEAFTGEASAWAARELLAHPSEDLPPVSGAPSATRPRVLLIDDNADMRDHVRRLLDCRYEVIPAANGREGLELAMSNPPDLVLTDIMMPVMDGFELLKRLRAEDRTKTIPVVLLSARAGEESRIEGLDAGADDYLVKPFTAREVLARVDAHLSLARMRREFEESRKLNEVSLGLALQSTRTIAWEWDPATDRIASTGDIIAIFGKEIHASAEGMQMIHPEDEARHRENLERVSREGGSWYSQIRIRRADTGEWAWLEERATAIPGPNGRVSRVVGVTADISERKAIEEEIQRRNADLERAYSELEEFAYVASHDLQEPLRTVNIYTDLLLRRAGLDSDPQTADFSRYIHDAVSRMELLIQDLLGYARVVHREQEPAGPASVETAFEESLHSLAGLIRESGASINYDLNGAVVLADERQLAQVFTNLISNALKYRRPDLAPEVRVTAVPRGGEWLITVADNGIGFAPEYAHRIFGLFKRLHRDKYPGTGLGLAICKRIVERYGGRMWASSAGPNQGAIFSIALKPAPNAC
jgi:signal transduction histidine kinase